MSRVLLITGSSGIGAATAKLATGRGDVVFMVGKERSECEELSAELEGSGFFVADGELINPFGRHAKGTAEIEKLFTEEQSGPMAGTTYSGTIESIRYIGDVAIVDAAAEITGMKGPDGAAAPTSKHHVTWIARKVDGKWMAEGARAFVYVPAPAPKASAVHAHE